MDLYICNAKSRLVFFLHASRNNAQKSMSIDETEKNTQFIQTQSEELYLLSSRAFNIIQSPPTKSDTVNMRAICCL